MKLGAAMMTKKLKLGSSRVGELKRHDELQSRMQDAGMETRGRVRGGDRMSPVYDKVAGVQAIMDERAFNASRNPKDARMEQAERDGERLDRVANRKKSPTGELDDAGRPLFRKKRKP